MFLPGSNSPLSVYQQECTLNYRYGLDVVKAICFIQLRFFKLHIHDEHHLEINILTCVSYYIYTK